ncbi:MAG TPA: S8 family serine peptidase [Rectinemataceae bacterium]
MKNTNGSRGSEKRRAAVYALLILAAAASATLAGCSFFLGGASGSPDQVARAMTPYERFAPTTQAALDAAAAEGWVSPDILIAKTRADFDPSAFASRGVEVLASLEMNGYKYFRLKAEGRTVRKAAKVQRLPGVLWAEHELVSRLPEGYRGQGIDADGVKGAAQIAAVLNDPKTWGRYGHFELTNALSAYTTYGFGANEVYVADIDTGINRTHEDFQKSGQSIVVRAMSAFKSTDGGYNFTFVGNDTAFVEVPADENWDEDGHGSHTAGTIAALGNNGIGVAGVAWDKVKLISYKCFSDNASTGSGSDWAVYGGLIDLVEWKEDQEIEQTIPVNMSLGGAYAGSFELEAINYALEHGIVIIASMGNDGTKRAKYPAAYKGVIAVGAVRANGEKVGFSTSGNHISVTAPGYCIYSTTTGADDAYEDMSGTSMSTPFVTGLVAYMLTFEPELTAGQIKTILEETAMDVGPAGWDAGTGYGIVDVKAAVGRVKNGDIPAEGEVYAAGRLKVSVTNIDISYDSGIASYPDAVGGMPVYLYDDSGSFVSMGFSNYTDGSVEFRLLAPGTYVAKANWQGNLAATEFTVTATGNQNITLEFDVQVSYIQTTYNTAKDPTYDTYADTVISLYDATGKLLAGPYDYDYLDYLEVVLDPKATYIVGIEPYDDTEYSKGEYGLIISSDWYDYELSTTLRRGTGADDDCEDNDSLDTAYGILYDTAYGLYLGDADYFSFTVSGIK